MSTKQQTDDGAHEGTFISVNLLRDVLGESYSVLVGFARWVCINTTDIAVLAPQHRERSRRHPPGWLGKRVVVRLPTTPGASRGAEIHRVC